MKVVIFIFALLATICAAFAYVPLPNIPPGRRPFPTFPGQGPFNPKIKWPQGY
uniref:Abaecin n=1 Tax=Apis cerana cerana TaxID=94128 RepID=B9UK29_APICC|nr:abaecin [Apis cerana cerana]ACH90418.1 abaecin [Apis cerana cerana]ACH90420.1 abaecin [Apis cerana cerana]